MTRLQRNVRAVKDRLGLVAASKALNVSPNTVLRILEGERVHRGTALLIESRLAYARGLPAKGAS